MYEIQPLHPYTAADVRYTNPLARCNKEKFGKKDVPVSGKVENFDGYDTVFIGFPIWYGAAPNVVNTFCKEYDWTGKKVYAFATSGGSGIGKTTERLQPYVKGGEVAGAKLVHSASFDEGTFVFTSIKNENGIPKFNAFDQVRKTLDNKRRH